MHSHGLYLLGIFCMTARGRQTSGPQYAEHASAKADGNPVRIPKGLERRGDLPRRHTLPELLRHQAKRTGADMDAQTRACRLRSKAVRSRENPVGTMQ